MAPKTPKPNTHLARNESSTDAAPPTTTAGTPAQEVVPATGDRVESAVRMETQAGTLNERGEIAPTEPGSPPVEPMSAVGAGGVPAQASTEPMGVQKVQLVGNSSGGNPPVPAIGTFSDDELKTEAEKRGLFKDDESDKPRMTELKMLELRGRARAARADLKAVEKEAKGFKGGAEAIA